jgi:hypothetical protein
MNISETAQDSLNEILGECGGDYFALCEEYGNQGICLDCGDLADMVEPDAAGYHCESCGANSVAGIESAILFASMGV